MSLPNHGQTPAKAAAVAGVSPVTARKWLVRYQAEGWAGLQDRWSVSLPNRSSRPKRLHQPTSARTIKRIIALRRQRLTGRHIAQMVGVSPATVSRVLKRAGLSRLKDLEPAEPARRYVHDDPGDMIHLDIKKLGRFIRTGHRITGDRTGQWSVSLPNRPTPAALLGEPAEPGLGVPACVHR